MSIEVSVVKKCTATASKNTHHTSSRNGNVSRAPSAIEFSYLTQYKRDSRKDSRVSGFSAMYLICPDELGAVWQSRTFPHELSGTSVSMCRSVGETSRRSTTSKRNSGERRKWCTRFQPHDFRVGTLRLCQAFCDFGWCTAFVIATR